MRKHTIEYWKQGWRKPREFVVTLEKTFDGDLARIFLNGRSLLARQHRSNFGIDFAANLSYSVLIWDAKLEAPCRTH